MCVCVCVCVCMYVCVCVFFLYVHDFLSDHTSSEGERWIKSTFVARDLSSIFDFRVRSCLKSEKHVFPANFHYKQRKILFFEHNFRLRCQFSMKVAPINSSRDSASYIFF